MDGDKFLADQKSAFATEILSLKQTLYEFVELLFLPSFVIEVSDFGKRIGLFVKQGRNEDKW